MLGPPMRSVPYGAGVMLRRGRATLPVAATAAAPRPQVRQLSAMALVAWLVAASLLVGLGRPVASAAPASTPAEVAAPWAASVERSVAAAMDALGLPATSITPTADGSGGLALQPPPGPGRFSMNLYRRGDFVSQRTIYWCVVASVQTMINIMEPGKPDRSGASQRQLQFQARRLDQDDDGFWRRLMGEERWRKGHHGLGLQDWAGLLNTNGFGPYVVDRAETRKHAIRKAARAVRLTGKPAGLVVWRGAHAWVMSGFEATADPAYTNDYKVTRVFIQDPWYPSVSSIWGASRRPNAAVPARALAQDYLPYDRPLRRHPKRDGKFMLVLPTLPAASSNG